MPFRSRHARHERSYIAAFRPVTSPVSGKTIVAKFDGGLLSSDGRLLLLRETEQRLRVAERLAGCIRDPRNPDLVIHTLADIVRFRLLMIGAGYEDGNDASALRGDPILKGRKVWRLPSASSTRNRRSRASRICPTLAPCCAWGALWSISIASRS